MTPEDSVQRAKEDYSNLLRAKNRDWIVADNPIQGLDPDTDIARQKERLEAVFYTIKTGESQSDYTEMMDNFPKEAVSRMQYKFANYLTSLREELVEKIPPSSRVFFDKVKISFSPTGRTNALAIAHTLNGDPLDGGLIFLNEGLYFSVGFLAKALVLANIEGEHAHLNQQSNPTIEKGVDFYIDPHPSKADSEFYATGNTYEEGEISTHISAVKAMILQFIVLHEFGHLILEHHKYNAHIKLSMFDDPVIIDSTDTKIRSFHDIEYEADQFAIDVIKAASSSKRSLLSNFYVIGAFFSFIECIERRLNSGISHTHPRPLDRLKRLASLITDEADKDLDFTPHLNQLLSLCELWSQKSVPAENSQ